ncbi:hypothetical protein ACEXQB_002990 [Herbiconiux sp. P18]|uniref:hypothetical protein n=1 Tax=Herbiconiux liangxiaofengii TaxID=3342795 RepID=UPI003CE895F6
MTHHPLGYAVFTDLAREDRTRWIAHRRDLLRALPDRYQPGHTSAVQGPLVEPMEPERQSVIWRVFSSGHQELAHSATLFSSAERARESLESIARHRSLFVPRCARLPDSRQFGWVHTLRGTPLVLASRFYDNWRDRNDALAVFERAFARLGVDPGGAQRPVPPLAFLQVPVIAELRVAPPPLLEADRRRPVRNIGRNVPR